MSMIMKAPIRIATMLAGFLSLTAIPSCGGGGSIAGIDGSGAKPDVSVTGAINGFGSVIVNGVHYNTDFADIYIRGEKAHESDLDVGDYVVVLGHVDAEGQGTAYEVYYQPSVTGAIDTIDYRKGQISILGQTVLLLDDTIYSNAIIPRNIEGLSVGQVVTVSGLSDSNHTIRATRIELNESNTVDLVGKIEVLDDESQTYTVNGVSVDVTETYHALPFKEGEWVVVSGHEEDNGFIKANQLDKDMDYRDLASVASVELNGFTSGLSDENSFYIDRILVSIDNQTLFVDGELGLLANNQKLSVKGVMGWGGVLNATQIKFVASPDTQVFGHIRNVSSKGEKEQYLGTIEVQGKTIEIGFDTRLVGDNERRISFEDLREGDTAIVSGYSRGERLIASSIMVDNREFTSNIIELQGMSHSILNAEKEFIIFDTQVKITGDTELDDSGQDISEEAFFASLAAGVPVQVRGYYKGYVLVAISAQLNPWHGFPPPNPFAVPFDPDWFPTL